MLNAFTVDVEDYYHVSAFADRIHPRQWDTFESRVVQNTHRMLRLLDRHSVRGTFFILGWVADRFPGLVLDIQKSGHEIGCHSFWHRLIYDLTPEEFFEDLSLGRKVLEEITGEPVVAYRAPSFSITKRSLWALDILAEQGFQIDSSIFPVVHDRYGIPDAPTIPHEIRAAGGTLWEFPPSVWRRCGLNVPISGGGYFRMYPLWFSAKCLRHVNQHMEHPFVFYVHPWEVDADQPRLPGTCRSRLRHYFNLSGTEDKLGRLLNQFSFGSMTDTLQTYRVVDASSFKPSHSPLRV
jgi:polysaccharide deacetylase family protein (PEP-CTERM system associated)